MRGKLTGIVGPMFSGKSTKLIEIYDNKEDSKVIFKPSIDTRYSVDQVTNHDGVGRDAISVKDSNELNERIEELYDSIFIDEVHFFDSGIIETIETLLDSGMNVYFSGINLDTSGLPMRFKGDNQPDFHMGDLLIRCDQIYLLTSLCELCGKTATRTIRIDWTNPEDFVGGKDKYHPRCREHLENTKSRL